MKFSTSLSNSSAFYNPNIPNLNFLIKNSGRIQSNTLQLYCFDLDYLTIPRVKE